MYKALDAAWGHQERSWDDIASRALRTAMAFQIMTAVGAGERDPERLKLAALHADHHRDLVASRLRSRTRRRPAAKTAVLATLKTDEALWGSFAVTAGVQIAPTILVRLVPGTATDLACGTF
jgi:hypothetical protein